MTTINKHCTLDMCSTFTALRNSAFSLHGSSQHFDVLRKYTFTAVHTKTHKRRFLIYPLWRAFSNLYVYGERFYRLRVDGRPKRIKEFAFTTVCVYNRLRMDGALATPSYFTDMPLKVKETNISNEHSRLKNPYWREADRPVGYLQA